MKGKKNAPVGAIVITPMNKWRLLSWEKNDTVLCRLIAGQWPPKEIGETNVFNYHGDIALYPWYTSNTIKKITHICLENTNITTPA